MNLSLAAFLNSAVVAASNLFFVLADEVPPAGAKEQI